MSMILTGFVLRGVVEKIFDESVDVVACLQGQEQFDFGLLVVFLALGIERGKHGRIRQIRREDRAINH